MRKKAQLIRKQGLRKLISLIVLVSFLFTSCQSYAASGEALFKSVSAAQLRSMSTAQTNAEKDLANTLNGGRKTLAPPASALQNKRSSSTAESEALVKRQIDVLFGDSNAGQNMLPHAQAVLYKRNLLGRVSEIADHVEQAIENDSRQHIRSRDERAGIAIRFTRNVISDYINSMRADTGDVLVTDGSGHQSREYFFYSDLKGLAVFDKEDGAVAILLHPGVAAQNDPFPCVSVVISGDSTIAIRMDKRNSDYISMIGGLSKGGVYPGISLISRDPLQQINNGQEHLDIACEMFSKAESQYRDLSQQERHGFLLDFFDALSNMPKNASSITAGDIRMIRSGSTRINNVDKAVEKALAAMSAAGIITGKPAHSDSETNSDAEYIFALRRELLPFVNIFKARFLESEVARQIAEINPSPSPKEVFIREVLMTRTGAIADEAVNRAESSHLSVQAIIESIVNGMAASIEDDVITINGVGNIPDRHILASELIGKVFFDKQHGVAAIVLGVFKDAHGGREVALLFVDKDGKASLQYKKQDDESFIKTFAAAILDADYPYFKVMPAANSPTLDGLSGRVVKLNGESNALLRSKAFRALQLLAGMGGVEQGAQIKNRLLSEGTSSSPEESEKIIDALKEADLISDLADTGKLVIQLAADIPVLYRMIFPEEALRKEREQEQEKVRRIIGINLQQVLGPGYAAAENDIQAVQEYFDVVRENENISLVSFLGRLKEEIERTKATTKRYYLTPTETLLAAISFLKNKDSALVHAHAKIFNIPFYEAVEQVAMAVKFYDTKVANDERLRQALNAGSRRLSVQIIAAIFCGMFSSYSAVEGEYSGIDQWLRGLGSGIAETILIRYADEIRSAGSLFVVHDIARRHVQSNDSVKGYLEREVLTQLAARNSSINITPEEKKYIRYIIEASFAELGRPPIQEETVHIFSQLIAEPDISQDMKSKAKDAVHSMRLAGEVKYAAYIAEKISKKLYHDISETERSDRIADIMPIVQIFREGLGAHPDVFPNPDPTVAEVKRIIEEGGIDQSEEIARAHVEAMLEGVHRGLGMLPGAAEHASRLESDLEDTIVLTDAMRDEQSAPAAVPENIAAEDDVDDITPDQLDELMENLPGADYGFPDEQRLDGGSRSGSDTISAFAVKVIRDEFRNFFGQGFIADMDVVRYVYGEAKRMSEGDEPVTIAQAAELTASLWHEVINAEWQSTWPDGELTYINIALIMKRYLQIHVQGQNMAAAASIIALAAKHTSEIFAAPGEQARKIMYVLPVLIKYKKTFKDYPGHSDLVEAVRYCEFYASQMEETGQNLIAAVDRLVLARQYAAKIFPNASGSEQREKAMEIAVIFSRYRSGEGVPGLSEVRAEFLKTPAQESAAGPVQSAIAPAAASEELTLPPDVLPSDAPHGAQAMEKVRYDSYLARQVGDTLISLGCPEERKIDLSLRIIKFLADMHGMSIERSKALFFEGIEIVYKLYAIEPGFLTDEKRDELSEIVKKIHATHYRNQGMGTNITLDQTITRIYTERSEQANGKSRSDAEEEIALAAVNEIQLNDAVNNKALPEHGTYEYIRALQAMRRAA